MNRLALTLALAAILFSSSPVLATDVVIKGVVADVNGQPVTGAEVSIYRSKNVKKPADFTSNRTLADGAYSVTIPQGQYWAVATLRKGERRFGPMELGDKHSGEPVEVTAGSEPNINRDFTVMDLREAARQNQKKNVDLLKVSGRIINQNGSPVAMAYAMGDKGPKFKEIPAHISAWTDPSGEYLLLLPAGKYYLGAATAYPPGPEQALPQEIDITADTDGITLKVTAQDTVKPQDDAHAD